MRRTSSSFCSPVTDGGTCPRFPDGIAPAKSSLGPGPGSWGSGLHPLERGRRPIRGTGGPVRGVSPRAGPLGRGPRRWTKPPVGGTRPVSGRCSRWAPAQTQKAQRPPGVEACTGFPGQAQLPLAAETATSRPAGPGLMLAPDHQYGDARCAAMLAGCGGGRTPLSPRQKGDGQGALRRH